MTDTAIDMNLSIIRIPAFQDNYLWLIANAAGEAAVVDPGDADPVIRALEDNDLTLVAVLATHHHGDHIGGIDTLVNRYQCPVYGPVSENIPQVTHPLREGDRVQLLGATFAVLEVPGHTLDHIVYYSNDLAPTPVLFAGDTLFAGGCGRLFEGTPAQMYDSLSKLMNLPDTTRVYCAHEYTLANLTFAAAVEPDNEALARRLQEVREMRRQDIATVPSDLALERATNPFLRADEETVAAAASRQLGHDPGSGPETFAAIRNWKDNF